ncbi:hypothetical protein quinque_009807 [Culex quinquefasciatus]
MFRRIALWIFMMASNLVAIHLKCEASLMWSPWPGGNCDDQSPENLKSCENSMGKQPRMIPRGSYVQMSCATCTSQRE